MEKRLKMGQVNAILGALFPWNKKIWQNAMIGPEARKGWEEFRRCRTPERVNPVIRVFMALGLNPDLKDDGDNGPELEGTWRIACEAAQNSGLYQKDDDSTKPTGGGCRWR